ncbi:MAG: DUF1631 family protein [Burkholderiales bacterium]
MPIAPVLQRFVDDELARAPALIERTLAGTLQLLRDRKDSPLPASERAHQFAVVDALQTHAAAYRQAFVKALTAGVHEALREQQGSAAIDAPGSAGGLELMDESRVEIDIEISRAIQLIDTTAEWELRELQTFTSTLVGQIHVSAESNPFRPQVCASALWQAACVASPVPVHRTTLLRVTSGVAAGLLKNAWAAACTRQEAQGVEPGVYRSVVLNAGTTPGRGSALPDVDTPNAMSGLLASMPGGSAAMQVGVGNAAVAMGTASTHAAGPGSAEFKQALARLDELLRHPVAAATAEAAAASSRRLSAQQAALAASAGAPHQRQIIELVSRVFDAIAADPQLSPTFAPSIARLRGSALRVALQEPDMTRTTRHAVWQLIDHIGELGSATPQPADVRIATLRALCEALAGQLAIAAAPDATMYRRAMNQLDTLLVNQVESRLQAVQPTVQALHLTERRELLEHNLSQRLIDQMMPVRTTAGVRRFVTGPWAKVLADTMLRDGEQAETTRGYIKLVDELLWSVQLPDHPKSRQRLIGLLPDMLKRLRTGMAAIKLPAAEQTAALDELMAIHTEALRPNTRADSTALTPEQIVQQMRDEVLPARTGHGGFSDSVIDLASLETVPAEMLPSQTDEPVEDPRKRVDALRVGDRLRLFVRGRWCRVQLLWRSDQGLFFLFANETVAGRNDSVTRRALERLAGVGLMQPLEARPLVQRALDAVMREVGRVS